MSTYVSDYVCRFESLVFAVWQLLGGRFLNVGLAGAGRVWVWGLVAHQMHCQASGFRQARFVECPDTLQSMASASTSWQCLAWLWSCLGAELVRQYLYLYQYAIFVGLLKPVGICMHAVYAARSQVDSRVRFFERVREAKASYSNDAHFFHGWLSSLSVLVGDIQLSVQSPS